MITGSPRTLKYKSRREKRRRKKLESGEQPERVRACRSLHLRAHRRIILYTRGRASAKVQLNPLLCTRCGHYPLHQLPIIREGSAKLHVRLFLRMAPKVQGLLISDLAL